MNSQSVHVQIILLHNTIKKVCLGNKYSYISFQERIDLDARIKAIIESQDSFSAVAAYDPEQEVFDKDSSPIKPVKEEEEPKPVPAPVPAPVPPPVAVLESPHHESESDGVMSDDELHNLLGV